MALLKLSLLALAFLRGSQRQTWSVTVFNQRIKTEIRIKFKSGCFTEHRGLLRAEGQFKFRQTSPWFYCWQYIIMYVKTNLKIILGKEIYNLAFEIYDKKMTMTLSLLWAVFLSFSNFNLDCFFTNCTIFTIVLWQ